MLEIIGAIFIIVVGTLLHFAYDWTHHNKIVGFFTAVNESTWEHLKLILTPTFIWAIVEFHFYHNNPMYFFARFVGLLTMLAIILAIFYAYKAIFKKTSFAVNIISFIKTQSPTNTASEATPTPNTTTTNTQIFKL